MSTAFPLTWPQGWPRTPLERRGDGSQFSRPYPTGPWTWDEALEKLDREIGLLRASGVVVSSNFERDLRGNLRPGRSRPSDQGIALYFTLRGKPKVMACDRFVKAEHNMRSLTLAIDAMRALERHGGGIMMERAFEGFAAIEAPGTKAWWLVLQIKPTASPADIEAAYRVLARERHPDRGGSESAMSELNAARDAARKARP